MQQICADECVGHARDAGNRYQFRSGICDGGGDGGILCGKPDKLVVATTRLARIIEIVTVSDDLIVGLSLDVHCVLIVYTI